MKKLIRNFTHLLVAITLVAFAMSAIPSLGFASDTKTDSQISHFNDGQSSEHQKDGQCDDGCCVSHCFCAGYAIPTGQVFNAPSLKATALLPFSNQKTESSSTSPNLRPPRNLA